jgi:hypothetical protein
VARSDTQILAAAWLYHLPVEPVEPVNGKVPTRFALKLNAASGPMDANEKV